MPHHPSSRVPRLAIVSLVAGLGTLQLPAQSHDYQDGETNTGSISGPALNVASGSATQRGDITGHASKTGAGTLTIFGSTAQGIEVANGTLNLHAAQAEGLLGVSGSQSVLNLFPSTGYSLYTVTVDEGGTLNFASPSGSLETSG